MDIIDYFLLSNRRFLRYGLWRPQSPLNLGTVVILPDYGSHIEDIAPLATMLKSRGFYVAAFEWLMRESSPENDHLSCDNHILPAPLEDFRDCLKFLKEIFSSLFLTRLPAPFYGFGMGMGAVLGLAAHAILQSQLRRFLLVSPLFAPHGHKPNGPFHRYTRLMNDLGLAGWRTNRPIVENVPQFDAITMARQNHTGTARQLYPTLGCYQGLLDATQLIFSPDYREKITIPLLCILSSSDRISTPGFARQFFEDLRCGAAITLRHSARFPFDGDTPHSRQFWRAFDAFIPGTGAPAPDRSLEDGLVI